MLPRKDLVYRLLKIVPGISPTQVTEHHSRNTDPTGSRNMKNQRHEGDECIHASQDEESAHVGIHFILLVRRIRSTLRHPRTRHPLEPVPQEARGTP